jgi:hypothetical protein
MVFPDTGFAAFFGGTVGAAELLTRYRADPRRVFQTKSAWLYIGINALSTVGALFLIHVYGWTFGGSTGMPQRTTQVLVAGFGATTLFRSSLFITRIGDRDVGIGPSAILTVFMSTTDRAVDRAQAGYRSKQMQEVMDGVSFAKAWQLLPAVCLSLMQQPDAQEQKKLAIEVNEIRRSKVDDQAKTQMLGLVLMNVFGPDVLRGAVTMLGDRIRTTPDKSASSVAE